MSKKYQVYDQHGTYGQHPFKSYINGYVESLKEAKEQLVEHSKSQKQKLELHVVDFNGKFVRKVKTNVLDKLKVK